LLSHQSPAPSPSCWPWKTRRLSSTESTSSVTTRHTVRRQLTQRHRAGPQGHVVAHHAQLSGGRTCRPMALQSSASSPQLHLCMLLRLSPPPPLPLTPIPPHSVLGFLRMRLGASRAQLSTAAPALYSPAPFVLTHNVASDATSKVPTRAHRGVQSVPRAMRFSHGGHADDSTAGVCCSRRAAVHGCRVDE
jgi:hypothetical protein